MASPRRFETVQVCVAPGPDLLVVCVCRRPAARRYARDPIWRGGREWADGPAATLIEWHTQTHHLSVGQGFQDPYSMPAAPGPK